MSDKTKVEDSLLFCKDITYYEMQKKQLQFDQENYPNLKHYIGWRNNGKVPNYPAIQRTRCVENNEYSINGIPLDTYEDMMMNENRSNKKGTDVKRGMLQFFACAILSAIVVLLFTTYIATFTCVNGESMENTLHNGDYLMIDRMEYAWNAPEQFDVIAFENTPKSYYVKRIIGLPGQTVQIIDGDIAINGEVITEPYGNEGIQNAGKASKLIQLGEDEYFVLGDNRNQSIDSRFGEVGIVKRQQIIGKVALRLYPFNTFGEIN